MIDRIEAEREKLFLVKGYRVGPVYDDVLAMAWFFLELIVKSMALDKTRLFYHNLPTNEDIPLMQLKEGVFRCIMQLYDCLLTEVHERCKKGLIELGKTFEWQFGLLLL
uniref:Uncharacterized protein n=1 Tax=Quercus lobata TaxID=97700 RepID=A0A7N2LJU9_QUELO